MIDSDEIYEIIESRREELGLTQAQVSQLAFNRNDTSAIQNIKRGSSPSIDKLFKIGKALNLECYFGPLRNEANITAQIIKNPDEAAMLKHPEKMDKAAVKEAIAETSEFWKDQAAGIRENYTFLYLHEIQASAGSGHVNEHDDQPSSLAFSNVWLKRIGINPNAASLIYVKGDSMEPTLRSGSIVLIDHQEKEPTGKHVYAVRNGEDLLVKRLERPNAGTLLLSSDNPQYETKVLTGFDLEAVDIVGKVVWSAYTLEPKL